jgi:hypothetical protein
MLKQTAHRTVTIVVELVKELREKENTVEGSGKK